MYTCLARNIWSLSATIFLWRTPFRCSLIYPQNSAPAIYGTILHFITRHLPFSDICHLKWNSQGYFIQVLLFSFFLFLLLTCRHPIIVDSEKISLRYPFLVLYTPDNRHRRYMGQYSILLPISQTFAIKNGSLRYILYMFCYFLFPAPKNSTTYCRDAERPFVVDRKKLYLRYIVGTLKKYLHAYFPPSEGYYKVNVVQIVGNIPKGMTQYFLLGEIKK